MVLVPRLLCACRVARNQANRLAPVPLSQINMSRQSIGPGGTALAIIGAGILTTLVFDEYWFWPILLAGVFVGLLATRDIGK